MTTELECRCGLTSIMVVVGGRTALSNAQAMDRAQWRWDPALCLWMCPACQADPSRLMAAIVRRCRQEAGL